MVTHPRAAAKLGTQDWPAPVLLPAVLSFPNHHSATPPSLSLSLSLHLLFCLFFLSPFLFICLQFCPESTHNESTPTRPHACTYIDGIRTRSQSQWIPLQRKFRFPSALPLYRAIIIHHPAVRPAISTLSLQSFQSSQSFQSLGGSFFSLHSTFRAPG